MRRSLKKSTIIASQPAQFDEVLTEAVLRGVRAKYRDGKPATVLVDASSGGPLGDGSAEAPVATIEQASAIVDGLNHATITLAPGVYGAQK